MTHLEAEGRVSPKGEVGGGPLIVWVDHLWFLFVFLSFRFLCYFKKGLLIELDYFAEPENKF